MTPRSAVISFRTATRDHAFVTVQNGARIDAGTGVNHVVRLTRLTPGMYYTYTVGADSAVLAKGTFPAAQARATRFTFAVVGDFGSGNEREAAVALMIESWHPDFVQTVGDNAYPLGSGELLDRVIFGPYTAVMHHPAWFPALGNHDVKANGGKPELEAFHSLGSERWYRYTWGNTAVVVLDSDVFRAARLARSCASPATPWRALLASASPRGAARPGSHRAAASHPGFAATSCRWWRSSVQVVFEGHLHAYARSRPHNGVLYVAVDGGNRARIRRRRTDDPVCARRPGPLRRPAGGRRRSRGALSLPDGRREGAGRLPRELLTALRDCPPLR